MAGSGQIRIRCTKGSGVQKVSLSGDFDQFSAPDVRAVLDSIIVAWQPGQILREVIDLRRVRQLDSVALGLLVRNHRGIVKGGRGSVVHVLNGPDKLRLMHHLLDRLPVYKTMAEALAGRNRVNAAGL